jgi:stage V sporulation protein AC
LPRNAINFLNLQIVCNFQIVNHLGGSVNRPLGAPDCGVCLGLNGTAGTKNGTENGTKHAQKHHQNTHFPPDFGTKTALFHGIFVRILRVNIHNFGNNSHMDIETRNEKYTTYVSKISPRSRMFPGVIWAFLIGGLICCVGQSFYLLYDKWFPDYGDDQIGGLVSCTLILIASILTGFGIYDKLGTFAGGGSLVPITGFSNSVTSAAMEHRKEGIVFGTCANMFKIAGPVIVFGVALSMLVGLIYWIFSLFI